MSTKRMAAELASCQENLDRCEKKLKRSQESCLHAREKKRKEKDKLRKCKRDRAALAEENSTLKARCQAFEAELAAVKNTMKVWEIAFQASESCRTPLQSPVTGLVTPCLQPFGPATYATTESGANSSPLDITAELNAMQQIVELATPRTPVTIGIIPKTPVPHTPITFCPRTPGPRIPSTPIGPLQQQCSSSSASVSKARAPLPSENEAGARARMEFLIQQDWESQGWV